MKTAAQVVEDPPPPHGAEGDLRHLDPPGVAGPPPVAEEEEEGRRRRELGGSPKAAVGGVEAGDEPLISRLYRRLLEAEPRHLRRGSAEDGGHLLRRGEEHGPLVLPEVADPGDEVEDPDPPELRLLRDVGGGEEGLFVGGEEDGEGPASGAGHHLRDGHVDGVQVRPLLPVDLDGDEAGVQEPRHLLVLEGLGGHDVAPVAGGVADR